MNLSFMKILLLYTFIRYYFIIKSQNIKSIDKITIFTTWKGFSFLNFGWWVIV